MNYKKIYNKLVSHTLSNPNTGYTESHHILPKSMGGSDDKSNLVNFTPRQHFIAHRLLTKFTTGRDYHKMVLALTFMAEVKSACRHTPSSRLYERVRYEATLSRRETIMETNGYPAEILPLRFWGISNRRHIIRPYSISLKGRKYTDADKRLHSALVTCAQLGYKGFGISEKFITKQIKALGIFYKQETSSSKQNTYLFTEDFLNTLPTFKGCSRFYRAIVGNYQGIRNGLLTQKVLDWNYNNPLNLITLTIRKEDKLPTIRKLNAWEGDIPTL